MRIEEEKRNSDKALYDFANILIEYRNDINKIIEKYVFYENWLTTEAEENGIEGSAYSYLSYITDLFKQHIADHYTMQNGYTRAQEDPLHRWKRTGEQ